MPGLIGFLKEVDGVGASELLSRMAQRLEPEARFRREGYHEPGMAFGRVTLGITNPAPQPVWNAERTVGLVMDGELYEGEAAGRFLAETFVPNLSSGLMWGGEFEKKMGQLVLPKGVTVFDDPTKDVHAGLALMGSYRLDAEGEAARRVEIVKDGKLVGLLTERDLLKLSASTLLPHSQTQDHFLGRRFLVRDVMNQNVATTSPNTPLLDAAQRLFRDRLGCLPVVSESNDLLGILTTSDCMRAALTVLRT